MSGIRKESKEVAFQLAALECVRVNFVDIEHSSRIANIRALWPEQQSTQDGGAWGDWRLSYRENSEHVTRDTDQRTDASREPRGGLKSSDPGWQQESQRER